MKSKVLKVRNIPQTNVMESVKTKPYIFLFVIFLGGCFLMAYSQIFQTTGTLLVGFAIFALVVTQDRILLQLTEQFVIIHNLVDRDECKLLYWDEVLSWQYLKRSKCDYIVIEMIDGTTERSECHGRFKIESYFKLYAKDKQKKNRGKRRS